MKKVDSITTQQSLDKALNFLIMMAQTNRSISISETEEELGVSRPTAYAMLNSMLKYNFIEKDPETGKFTIGFRPFVMGTNYPKSFYFLYVIEDHIKYLQEKWNGRVNISIFKPPMNTVKILSYGGRKEPISKAVTGSLVPAYASGAGKVILATLADDILEKYIDGISFIKLTEHTITDKEALLKEIKKVREQGYGRDREELVYGNQCVASAIFDSTYKAIAAISISCPSQYVEENLEAMAFDVKTVASRASSDLGFSSTADKFLYHS